jgi:Cu-processing system permease protein
MDIQAIMAIAHQELTINVRNKWTLLFAGIFGVLVLGISYFGLLTAGSTGFQGFTRTSASLLNLVLYVVPLVAVTMGTLSFANDKSAGEILFAQPVNRFEILLGKLAGLFIALASATLLGFGIAGVIIATQAGNEGITRYPALVGFSLLLALIFLSLSALTSILCRRKIKAFGAALFIWFFFVIFFDLIVIGLSFLVKEHTANQILFLSLFVNPVDMVRVATLILLDGKDVFGSAGATLIRFYGNNTGSVLLLVAGLMVWVGAPMFISSKILNRQDI